MEYIERKVKEESNFKNSSCRCEGAPETFATRPRVADYGFEITAVSAGADVPNSTADIASGSSEKIVDCCFSQQELEYINNEVSIIRHYAPYILQEEKAAARAKIDESIHIPRWLDYDKCIAIRFESREKLKKYQPENLAQASRISGVNPADVSVLAIIIKRGYI